MGPGSLRHPLQQIHKLRHLAPLVGLVAGCNGVLDAMGDMVAQNILLDPIQCGLNRIDLGDDIDAIAVFIDHFCDASNLSFDPVQLFANVRLDVVSHAAYIPP